MLGLPKCEFAVSKIEFLGHFLSTNGRSPLKKHSIVISAFPPPSDKPALQRFLEMLNFYRKFLRGAALVLAPLTATLIHPRTDAPISLSVDASNTLLGAVLQQLLDG